MKALNFLQIKYFFDTVSLPDGWNSKFSKVYLSKINLTTMKKEEKMEAFGKLLDIMDELREKCPWDREQNLDSLKPFLIEECYELIDAIDSGDVEKHKEELGDMLLQMPFWKTTIRRSRKSWVISCCTLFFMLK